MKIVMTLVALMLVVGFTEVAHAAKKDKSLKGQISAIDGAKITVTTGGKKNPMTVDVMTDATTTVTLDGKDAKVADLKTGHYVMVTPDTGTATSITATTTKPEKKPKA